MSRKARTSFLTAAATVAIALSVVTIVLFGHLQKPLATSTQQALGAHTIQEIEPTSVLFVAEKNKNILDQLKDRAAVTTKDSPQGSYIESINTVRNGTGNRFWTFYVNGQLAQQNAAEYVTEGGETIEWKFE